MSAGSLFDGNLFEMMGNKRRKSVQSVLLSRCPWGT